MHPTPGRLSGRSGVFLFCVLAVTGCEAVGGGESIQLDSTEVALPGSLHTVEVGGAGAVDSIAPAEVTAKPGDAVRFTVLDHRTHALAFAAESLDARALSFLERTGQLRGPPLVTEGAAWVVMLEEAPPGRYPFLCRSHDARGVLTVTGGD